MKEYLEKYRDIFDLRLRIKEIDKNYELVFNKKTKQVEVHDFTQRGDSFVARAFPLDARLINLLKQTRSSRVKEFFAEIDEFNRALIEKNNKQISQTAEDKLREIANYSFIKNRDLSQEEISKILNKGDKNA